MCRLCSDLISTIYFIDRVGTRADVRYVFVKKSLIPIVIKHPFITYTHTRIHTYTHTKKTTSIVYRSHKLLVATHKTHKQVP